MGWGAGYDFVAQVAAHQGGDIPELVVGQVLGCDKAVIGLQVLAHPPGQLTLIEILRAVFGQVAQGSRIIGITQDLAGVVGAAILAQINPAGFRVGKNIIQ